MLHRLHRENLYLNNIIKKIRFSSINRKVSALAQKASTMDIECDAANYIDIKQEISGTDLFRYQCAYAESLYYGHLQAFLDYGKLCGKDAFHMPVITHGVLFDDNIQISDRCFIHQGRHHLPLVHKERPYVPIFAAGPYVHYARPFWDADTTSRIKQEWGRTLLIVPHHTIEWQKAQYDCGEFVNRVIAKYGKDCNTIAACLYWNDFDGKIYEACRSAGVRILSAGFRFDGHFINRLRTILELSDLVVSNSISTHVGYSLQMNKPFVYEHSDLDVAITTAAEREHFDSHHSTGSKLAAIFANVGADMETQKQLTDSRFGFSQIKSQEEIHALADIGRRAHRNSLGFITMCQKAVKRTLLELSRTQTENGQLAYRLLRDAVGKEALPERMTDGIGGDLHGG